MKNFNIKIGDRVLVRSNEPEQLLIGTLVDYFDNDGKWTTSTPMVRDEKTNEIFNCCGVVLPYSEKLYQKLLSMLPIEQYNWLSSPPHQLKEKYGISYKTFYEVVKKDDIDIKLIHCFKCGAEFQPFFKHECYNHIDELLK